MWARANSIHSASRKFVVTRSVVQRWMKQANDLNRQVNTTARGGKRKRLGGGGRAVLHPDLDVELAEWIKEVRENKRIVSRNIIRNKANELFHGTDIKISNGWLEKFLLRHNFSLRRVGSAAQKPPEKYAEVVARFIVYVEQRRKEVQFTQIIAMDETAVWFDCPDNMTIETKGAKSVTVVTTGHEKMRVTVCLSARSDGRKLPPYVLINRKRPVPVIVNQFKGKLVISWAGTVWRNDSLRTILGKSSAVNSFRGNDYWCGMRLRATR